MSRDYSDHYTFSGWDEGHELDPPEPGKEWLTIYEDGEEYAIIVLRTSVFEGRPAELNHERAVRVERAARIVDALNAYQESS